MIKRLFIITLALGALPLFGQYMEFGPYVGGSYYLGDLNPGKHFVMTHPAYGGLVRFNITPRWVARLNFMYGKVSGDDLKTQAVDNRGLNFSTPIMEISVLGEVNFLPYYTGSKRSFFTPYLFGGIGVFTMNPTGIINGEKYNLVELGTEGQLSGSQPDREPYSLTQFCIPFGLGIRFSIGKGWCVGAEWGMRKTFTDYIDDCSTTYYLDSETTNFSNVVNLASDPTKNHKPGMQRGHSEYKDWYAFMGVTVTYKINLFKKSDCNQFSSPHRGFN